MQTCIQIQTNHTGSITYVGTVEDTLTNYTYAKETSTNTLETISFEEGIHALEEAKQNMYNDIVEYMIFAIDSYENEVYELDTDDPFYGLYVGNGGFKK